MNFQEALTNFSAALSLPGYYIARQNGLLSVSSYNVLMAVSVIIISALLWRSMTNVKN